MRGTVPDAARRILASLVEYHYDFRRAHLSRMLRFACVRRFIVRKFVLLHVDKSEALAVPYL